MTDRILELARALGRVSEQEQALLPALCRAAELELSGQLREGVSPGECEDAFCVAGAWLALAGLAVSRSADQAESFSAGDLTIRAGDGAARADALRRQARQLMAPWLADSGFLFYGVSGT